MRRLNGHEAIRGMAVETYRQSVSAEKFTRGLMDRRNKRKLVFPPEHFEWATRAADEMIATVFSALGVRVVGDLDDLQPRSTHEKLVRTRADTGC